MFVCLKLGSDAQFSLLYLEQHACLQFGKTFHVSVCCCFLSRTAIEHYIAHFFLHGNFLEEIMWARLPPEAVAVYKLIERKHSICTAKVGQLVKGNGRDHLVCAFMAFPPTYAQCSFLSCHLTLVCVLAAPKYT